MPLLVIWFAAVLVAFVVDDTGVAGGTVVGGGLGGLLVVQFYFPARARRHADHEQVECGLRVAEGEQLGLQPSRRHGVGTLARGRLAFRSTVGGVRFLRRIEAPPDRDR